MNYLSHFYLVQDQPDPYLVLGMVLPDMVRNHRKDWKLHPRKHLQALEADPVLASVSRGWQFHLETDRRFHSSFFFRKHSGELRKLIAGLLDRRPFRPFFLAHVALELLLDSLLLLDGRVDPGAFYQQLAACDEKDVIRFLEINGVPEAPSFIDWYRRFIREPYLFSYSSTSSLSQALDGIGRRVWFTPLPAEETRQIADILLMYRTEIESNYLPVFEEITYYLRLL